LRDPGRPHVSLLPKIVALIYEKRINLRSCELLFRVPALKPPFAAPEPRRVGPLQQQGPNPGSPCLPRFRARWRQSPRLDCSFVHHQTSFAPCTTDSRLSHPFTTCYSAIPHLPVYCGPSILFTSI
jgi:hypothetical protein